MPRITKLKSQKSKKRMNVYLDEKFAFGIDLDNLVKYDLKVDQEYSDEQIDKIVKDAELQKTFDKLMHFATIRLRSEKEVEFWLKRKKVPESLHKELFDRLKRLNLLDDEKFAAWWVEQRNQFRPRSKRVLINELRVKGIDKNIIEDVLEENVIDEEKIAKELYEKNKYKWEKLPEYERKQKAYAYLARKGFSWDVIKKVVIQ